MAPTYAALLDEAKTRLQEILQAGVEDFGEGGERARMLRIRDLMMNIKELEQLAANEGGTSGKLLPVRMADV